MRLSFCYPGGAVSPSGANPQLRKLPATCPPVEPCSFVRLLVLVLLETEGVRKVKAFILCRDGSPRGGKVHFSMSRLVLFCSKLRKISLPRPRPRPRPHPPLCFRCSSCGRFDRCLNETGSLKGKTTKRTGTLGARPLACLPLNGGASWDVSSLGTPLKRARAPLAARAVQ